MLCAEPLHVQHCASSLFGGDRVVAQGPNSSTLPEERMAWNYCLVRSNPLELRFFRFLDGQFRGVKLSCEQGPPIPGSSFFTLSCLNSNEICRKGGEKYDVLSSLQSSMVVDCVLSSRTKYPHVAGSMVAHAIELLEKHQKKAVGYTGTKEETERRSKKDFVLGNHHWLAYLSLALALPSVVLLLRLGPGESRRGVLLLRPHVHAGKNTKLGYWASLVLVSELSRYLAVSPSGGRVVIVPERFDTIEDPLYSSDPASVILTGQWITIDSSVASPKSSVLNVLAGELIGGHRGTQRMARVLGSSIMWVQCRESAGWMREVEVILGSHRGNLLVCIAGSLPGTRAQGDVFHCARFFVAACAKGRSGDVSCPAKPTLALGNTSCFFAQSEGALRPLLQGIPQTAKSLLSSPGPFAVQSSERAPSTRMHVPRQRVRGCSGDGLVWICVPEAVSEGTEITVVLSCAAAGEYSPPVENPGTRVNSTALYDEEDGDCRMSCLLPKGVTLHDVFFVYHPLITGVLIAGMSQNVNKTSSFRHSNPQNPGEVGSLPGCPLQLFFMVFGSGEYLPIAMESFRQWKSLPKGFFSEPHSVRLLNVDVVEDPAGAESLLVALGSSGAAQVVATALVSLPRVKQEVLNELCHLDGAAHLSMLVATHVAQSLVRLQEHAEWQERQCPSNLFPVLRNKIGISMEKSLILPEMLEKSLETSLTTFPKDKGQALISVAPMGTAVVECMMELELLKATEDRGKEWGGEHCQKFSVLNPLLPSNLCQMEEEIVKVLRVQLLEAQRKNDDVNPCLRCLCGVFAGVQRGLERGGVVGSKVVHQHLDYFRALSAVLQSAMDVLVMSGSLTGIFVSVSTLLYSHHREHSRGGNSEVKAITSLAERKAISWWSLLQPVFDAAFIATRGFPMAIPSLLHYCTPTTQGMAIMEKNLFLEKSLAVRGNIDQKDSPLLKHSGFAKKIRPLDEIMCCAAAGPAQWGTLSEWDLSSAARRLFLIKGAGAAMQLLQPICSTRTCPVGVKELYEMYAKMKEKSSAFEISQCGRSATV